MPSMQTRAAAAWQAGLSARLEGWSLLEQDEADDDDPAGVWLNAPTGAGMQAHAEPGREGAIGAGMQAPAGPMYTAVPGVPLLLSL